MSVALADHPDVWDPRPGPGVGTHLLLRPLDEGQVADAASATSAATAIHGGAAASRGRTLHSGDHVIDSKRTTFWLEIKNVKCNNNIDR